MSDGKLPFKLFALFDRPIPSQPTGKFMRPPEGAKSERAIVLVDDDLKEAPVGLGERRHFFSRFHLRYRNGIMASKDVSLPSLAHMLIALASYFSNSTQTLR